MIDLAARILLPVEGRMALEAPAGEAGLAAAAERLEVVAPWPLVLVEARRVCPAAVLSFGDVRLPSLVVCVPAWGAPWSMTAVGGRLSTWSDRLRVLDWACGEAFQPFMRVLLAAVAVDAGSIRGG